MIAHVRPYCAVLLGAACLSFAGSAAEAAPGPETNPSGITVPKEPLEFLGEITVSGPKPAALPPLSYKGRTVIGRFDGGTAAGPVLNGAFLPAGEDWGLMRPDGASEMEANLLLQTSDGAVIKINYQGRGHMNPVPAGQKPGPDDHYARFAVYFDTTSEKYAWLNGIMAVGYAKGAPNGLTMRIYEVK